MAQKANLYSLRKRSPKINISLSNHSKLVIHLILFIENFNQLLNRHGIWVIQTQLLTQKNSCQLYVNIYISAKQIVLYKKYSLIKKPLKIVINQNKNILFKLFAKFFKFYTKSLYFFHFRCINSKVNVKLLKVFYPLTIQQLKQLFVRRFNLLIDFLTITTLLCQNLFSANQYLLLLSKIFKFLIKRRHFIFLEFLDKIFKLIYENSSIRGLKFVLNGKIKGKTRAKKVIIKRGGVANQTVDADIDFSVMHTYNRYGAFGMRLWIQRF